ncbi:hypothetical protein EUAN_12280 [Andreesenia angusta]|uniref:Uncharacterized protein n=1 Tax=Andreesenia angusta TaxID=39480 RepID=A0A1S1V8U5_9FIRM|nr:hypothetical protein [Andreesenia angusta]OHW62159.1 hypothetical protein EUAN_12280 [Andreesenia angusta]
MITQEGLAEITQAIKDLISHVTIEANSTEQRVEIYKLSTQEGVIKAYVLLDDTFINDVSNIKLISKSNKVLIERPENIQKDISKGLLLFFSLKVMEG